MDRILLVFPPIWDLFTPYTSIPTLSAFLKQKGVSAAVWDANIELHDQIVSDAFLQECLACHEKELSQLKEESPLYERTLKKISLARLISGQVDEAKRKLRHACDDRQTMLHCKNMLGNMMAVFPGNFEWLRHDQTVNSLEGLRKTMENARHYFLYPLMARQVEERLALFSGDLVGISVAGKNQLVYAFLIAGLIKEKRPEAKVVMGGAMLPYLRDVLVGKGKYLELDFLVVGEGETPLIRLLEVLEQKGDFSTVPNLVYPDETNRYRCSRLESVEEMDDLPVPDYTVMPLEKYFLQPCRLSYLTARGCYWNRCVFCSLACNYGHRYHSRRMDKVMEDIAFLKTKYDLRYLNFNDECIPPKRFFDLSQKILESGIDLKWFALLRLEEGLTREHFDTAYRSGLRMVSYGVESGDQETLDRMRKGTLVGAMSRILQESHAAGIWNNIFVIANFPGETHLQETVRFLRENAEAIDSLGYTTFRLENHSYAYSHPEEFGFELNPVSDDYFGPVFPYQEKKIGSNAMQSLDYIRRECQNFHFNMPEFFGYDECRIVAHIDKYGKETIRGQNIGNLAVKSEVIARLERGNDFHLEVGPHVQIEELPHRFLLAYHRLNSHAIFNEVTATLLELATEKILYSVLLEKLGQVFGMEIPVIKRDVEQILPLLVVLDFLALHD